jgi:hypothetical protein
MGYEIPDFRNRSAVTGKDVQKRSKVGNAKQAVGSSDTKAQGIVEKKVSPGLAES